MIVKGNIRKSPARGYKGEECRYRACLGLPQAAAVTDSAAACYWLKRYDIMGLLF